MASEISEIGGTQEGNWPKTRELRGRSQRFGTGFTRGGVPVAYEVARSSTRLSTFSWCGSSACPVIANWRWARSQAEASRVLNPDVIEALGIPPAEVDSVAASELLELERQQRPIAGNAPVPALRGPHSDRSGRRAGDRIHDASGRRSSAARQSGAYDRRSACGRRRNRAQASGETADRIVYLIAPPEFHAVSMWYDDFSQTSDEEVA